MGELALPRLGYASLTVVGAGELPVDCSRGVGVIVKVDREEGTLLERVTVVEGPERRLQRGDDVAPTLDLRRLLALEGAGSHLTHLFGQRLVSPVAADRAVVLGEQILFAGSI